MATANIGFEEDRDEYTFENIFWVPKEARLDFKQKISSTFFIKWCNSIKY